MKHALVASPGSHLGLKNKTYHFRLYVGDKNTQIKTQTTRAWVFSSFDIPLPEKKQPTLRPLKTGYFEDPTPVIQWRVQWSSGHRKKTQAKQQQ